MKKYRIASSFIAVLAAIALLACGEKATVEPAVEVHASAELEAAAQSVYEAALANPNRLESDRARDAARKPDQVLQFAGIRPGMTVVDLFTGGGYYAEIIAYVVGSEGKVIAQSNEAYMNFGDIGATFNARFGNDRLPNVEILMAANNELALDTNSIDAAMLVLSFHDLWLEDVENGWARIDVDAFLAELRSGLKAGGCVVIVDHTGAAGISPEESGAGLHRIDPAVVVARMEGAGFKLTAQSDILRNPGDDLSKMVFADDIRGNTDRFVMTFTSPD